MLWRKSSIASIKSKAYIGMVILNRYYNIVFNDIRHEIYVLLYTIKNIQIYSKNSSKKRRYSVITAMSVQ